MWVTMFQLAGRKARVGMIATYSSRFRGRKRSSSLHGGDSMLSGRGSRGRGLELSLSGVVYDRVLD